ncbi:1,4-dihydroxy-6-naphthoate synthase [Agriterribacter sp.]|uniref:1,4-dihydroxy-6-naphthoate synthase n=1 Tax=Agriterribacter sp. TaxID=2821509 RepID=UPI002CC4EA2F|nr:1,4-dihydroxy-6-naphthoate synthase [Agriterribacter sp.]HRO46443.1 1,4-dihydroxy-6-naphthoate synthase [Agriterribacter sp.]HRQ17342.1 1,4-dihydroxy-6-naphthoate synthase [Agriterribacter sp.]
MKLTLGFSPCPNDTFIFDALVNGKMDTKGLSFEVVLEDVQTLNEWAIEGKLDVSKVSCGALPLMLQHYVVLQSGGALGKGVGPLLISGQPAQPGSDIPNMNDYTIAIPGENTTAHLLFSLAFPNAKKKIFKVFNEIEDFLLHAPAAAGHTAGVIIHENRFTYQKRGLFKLMDLGDYWEKRTGYPIPLGGIVTRRSFSPEIQSKLNALIRQSVEYAFGNYPLLPPYVVQHAQEMEEEVMRRHIDLYVNQYSINLGADGRKAVKRFIEINEQGKKAAGMINDIFIQSL